MSESFDVAVIGGGIVGLAWGARSRAGSRGCDWWCWRKKRRVGAHQSGHNSGVIHSGVYYKPGSLKAKLCVTGAAAMVEFCREHGVPFAVCGKVIVATTAAQMPRLQDLLERGQANGVAGLRMLGPEELREFEPHASGVAALLVPGTGVTDYAKVCEKYAELIGAQGGEVRTSTEVVGIRTSESETVIETSGGAIAARAVINCAGLFSDRIAGWRASVPRCRLFRFAGSTTTWCRSGPG